MGGIISIAGIVFKPTALASIFNLPTYEYTEERIALNTVFKNSFLDSFINKIEDEADANQQVKLNSAD